MNLHPLFSRPLGTLSPIPNGGEGGGEEERAVHGKMTQAAPSQGAGQAIPRFSAFLSAAASCKIGTTEAPE